MLARPANAGTLSVHRRLNEGWQATILGGFGLPFLGAICGEEGLEVEIGFGDGVLRPISLVVQLKLKK